MRKHNQRFKLLLFKIKFTLWHIELNIHIWKMKFTSHKQRLLRILVSRNANKNHTDQSIPQNVLLCLKRNNSRIFKSSSCKQTFSPACNVIGATCFDECFLLSVITGRHCFLKILLLLWDFFHHHVFSFL